MFSDGELVEDSVIKKYLITAKDGKNIEASKRIFE